MQPPAAYRNSSSFDLRRSTSSKSFGQQPPVSGYVALLRKQKATVWCDRAQFEDPRLAAQQRAAKMRAAAEVSEGVAPFGSISTAGGRTATGITSHGKVTSKITGRHHGKTPMVGYAGENHVGVGGVPMRLSATEVEAESSDDEDVRYPSRGQHSRNGSSGHSSVVSNRRNMPHRTSIGANGAQQQAAAAAVAGGPRRFGPGDTPERAGSLASTVEGPPTPVRDDAASAVSGRAMSAGSGSSVERADNLGELGAPSRLASKSIMHSAIAREKSAAKNADDLRRRGSVDERTSTLTSGRLFIANPD
ncbi:hypothetical protein ESCO_000674 [Escovopsis weberi]|uniref:Uncharacterized protein n=1 Tax=Escovopsis weberi TaxID=150374 RepID=A0A0M8N359_ESCWE|nr:hypothetical protein ESCO_000674 [Escovopsis weberi]